MPAEPTPPDLRPADVLGAPLPVDVGGEAVLVNPIGPGVRARIDQFLRLRFLHEWLAPGGRGAAVECIARGDADLGGQWAADVTAGPDWAPILIAAMVSPSRPQTLPAEVAVWLERPAAAAALSEAILLLTGPGLERIKALEASGVRPDDTPDSVPPWRRLIRTIMSFRPTWTPAQIAALSDEQVHEILTAEAEARGIKPATAGDWRFEDFGEFAEKSKDN